MAELQKFKLPEMTGLDYTPPKNERDIYQLLVFKEYISMTDALTGLPNRRFAENVFSTFHNQARRDGHSQVVAMLDIDKFKNINDTYGHDAGDDVLRQVAERLNTLFDKKSGSGMFIRPQDSVARWGGEEILVTLDGSTKMKNSRPPYEIFAAETDIIRGAIESRPYLIRTAEGPKEISVTASFGMAVFNPNGSDSNATLGNMITRADKALYKAKGKMPDGKSDDPNETDARNRVCFEGEGGEIFVFPRRPKVTSLALPNPEPSQSS